VGPARLFTINASLPFEPNSASTRSFERSPETSNELNDLNVDQALEPLFSLSTTTTTQQPITTTFHQTVDYKSIDSLRTPETVNEDTTAILTAPVIEFQRLFFSVICEILNVQFILLEVHSRM
jgi:hypothetical protein